VTKKKWEVFTEYVYNRFGISKEILDYIAVNDILLCCVAGLGNNTISMKYKLSADYVSDVLKEFLDFDGWEHDLDVNTFFIYETSGTLFESFKMMIELTTKLLTDNEIENAYRICKLYTKIKERIDDFYG
jgi:hypothetical protein